tara:strand:- start:250 stop:384 length:135 start_codon:yes stop_codon:yes gene_type:complete
MENSSRELFNESQKNPQNQQSSTDTAESVSEIEKLYLKIKEDWL